MDKICCNCKHLVSFIEPVGPGYGIIRHVCTLDKKEVKYSAACMNGKFENKV